MNDVLREQWLADQRGPRVRAWHFSWWTCLNLLVAAGLLCAVAAWGWSLWLSALFSAIFVAGILALPRYAGDGLRGLLSVADAAIVAGLTVTGLLGLVAVAGVVGAAIGAALLATSPWARRERTGRWRAPLDPSGRGGRAPGAAPS